MYQLHLWQNFFNFSVETQVFSTNIKVGKVASVYKSREKDDLNAYRPISVLPNVDRFLKIPFMGSKLLTLLALFCNSKGTEGGVFYPREVFCW